MMEERNGRVAIAGINATQGMSAPAYVWNLCALKCMGISSKLVQKLCSRGLGVPLRMFLGYEDQ